MFGLYKLDIFIILFFWIFTYISAIRWLGLNQATRIWNETSHCPRNKIERKKFGLIGFQTKLCKRFPEMMPVIMRAAKLTTYVCQKQFVDRRWNCSSIQLAPRLNNDLTKGTREQAYVFSLSSAAVTHQIAKACVTGELPYCPCGQTPSDTEPDFKWKGCSDNVIYGQKVSIEWADAAWRRKNKAGSVRKQRKNKMNRRINGLMAADMSLISMQEFMKDAGQLTPRAKMNKHNSEVGREITHRSLRKKCKCHGVSSSCNLKTCWKVLPRLDEIGQTLKEKYIRATEVRAMNKNPPTLQFEPVALMGSITKEDLVYVRKSPDYCTEDKRVGSLGTRGRLCNATAVGHWSCDSMCCGRGYETIEEEVEETCHCKYVHCCYVKCKKCRYFVAKHYCK